MLIEILEILILFVLPVALVYFKIIPFKHRLHTLYIVSILTLGLVFLEKMTLRDLGIRADNIIESVMAYAIFTIAGILLILAISSILKRKPQPNFFKNNHFIYVFILVSIAQEFMFRGFLFPKLEAIISQDLIVILINAILFTLIHSIYSNDAKSLAMIFIGGICFAGIYMMYPNLILITISHAILNFLAVLYNFYHEEKTNIKIAGYWGKILGHVNRIKDKVKGKKEQVSTKK